MANIVQFFRSLFSGATGPDLSFGLFAASGAENLLRQQQWEKFEALATDLSSSELTRLVDGLCLMPQHATQLAQYQASGSSDLRYLMAGAHNTFLAWEARSLAAAKHVTEGQANGFAHYLSLAHQHLSRTFATATMQAEAYARLIRVLMGQSEPAEAQEAFFACRGLVPDHLLGHMNYFKLAAPRWFGDANALAEFVDGAPAPALRHLLQANFLVERYSDFDSDIEESDNRLPAKTQLWQAYRSRIEQLLPLLQPLAGSSLLSIYFNNYAGCLHYVLGNVGERNHFLRALGSHITYYPWAYFGLETPAAVQKLNPKPQ